MRELFIATRALNTAIAVRPMCGGWRFSYMQRLDGGRALWKSWQRLFGVANDSDMGLYAGRGVQDSIKCARRSIAERTKRQPSATPWAVDFVSPSAFPGRPELFAVRCLRDTSNRQPDSHQLGASHGLRTAGHLWVCGAYRKQDNRMRSMPIACTPSVW